MSPGREGGEAEALARVEFAGQLRWRVIPMHCRDLAGMIVAVGFDPHQSSDRSSHRINVAGLFSFGCFCGFPLCFVVVFVMRTIVSPPVLSLFLYTILELDNRGYIEKKK